MGDMNRELFTLLGKPVTLYALCMVSAVVLGLFLFCWEQNKHRLGRNAAEIFVLLSLPLGIVGARIFYCLSRLTLYLEMGILNILQIWNGGYALWGAVGGVVLAAILTAKITRQPASRILDAAAAPSALAIGLGRLAEMTIGQGIGMEVETAFFQRFPFAVFNADYEMWFWAIFVMEAVAAFVILAVLLIKKPGQDGGKVKLFLILYCSAQILLESLRRDQFLRWLFVRVSQLTAVLVLSGLMFAALYRWIKNPQDRIMQKKQVVNHWVIFLVGVALSIGMEFAADKSAYLPLWLCYVIMAVCCVMFGFVSYRLILESVKPGEQTE